MVSEFRHLRFRPAEVVQAVEQYYRRTGMPMRGGVTSSCAVECDGPGAEVRFRIVRSSETVAGDARGGETSATPDIIVEGSNLAAALILYCRDRGIPLPVTSHKSLQQFGEDLCLLVTMNR